ncbi:MAG TPA: hypothetical protein VM689_08195 [Aliidongia sp.]|nr:hypothetical protein [Aliidongia sp.]
MKVRQLPTAAEVAIIIAVAVKRKEAELGRELTRIRLTEVSLDRFIVRLRRDGRFLEDVDAALARFNLHLIVVPGAFGLIRPSAVKGYPRLTSSIVKEELRAARRGTLDYDALFAELGGDEDEDEDGEGDEVMTK